MSKVRTRIQYGVHVDRTSRGLGYYLASISESRAFAEMQAEGYSPDTPATVKVRVVQYGEWTDLTPTTAASAAERQDTDG